MTWVRLDDNFYRHPKVRGLSSQAFRAWVSGLGYCSSLLTDGLIPRAAFGEIGANAKIAQELVRAGLWEEGTDGSVVVHDYLDYQTSRANVHASKDSARNRQRRFREAKPELLVARNVSQELTARVRERDGSVCHYCHCEVVWGGRGPRSGSIDHVIPVNAGGVSELANLVVACMRCNQSKNARVTDEFNNCHGVTQASVTRSDNVSVTDPPHIHITSHTKDLPSGDVKVAPAAPDAPARPKAAAQIRKKPRRDWPDGFVPSPKHIEKAREVGVNCNLEFEKFRGYVQANGKQYADFNAAFTNWLLNANEFKRSGFSKPPGLVEHEARTPAHKVFPIERRPEPRLSPLEQRSLAVKALEKLGGT